MYVSKKKNSSMVMAVDQINQIMTVPILAPVLYFNSKSLLQMDAGLGQPQERDELKRLQEKERSQIRAHSPQISRWPQVFMMLSSIKHGALGFLEQSSTSFMTKAFR